MWQLCSGQLAKNEVILLIFHATWNECLLALMQKTDKQAAGPLLIILMTVAHKRRLYLHIDSLSQMDNLCYLWFALEEEWGVKAALKAGTPLTNAVWAAGGPEGTPHTLSPSLCPPPTDGPHSTAVYLTLPCSLSAVRWNVITLPYNQNSNYSTVASLQMLKGEYFPRVQMCQSPWSCFD